MQKLRFAEGAAIDSVRFFVFLNCPMALWRDLSLQLHKIYDTAEQIVAFSPVKKIFCL